MAAKVITFNELPFRPDSNQVFYIENSYDIAVNDFIRSHYDNLKLMFERMGMDFYYLPYLLREHDIEAKVRYYAPYLSPKLLVQKVQSNALVRYISNADEKKLLRPSFIFGGRQMDNQGSVRFLTIALDKLFYSNDAVFKQAMALAQLEIKNSLIEEWEKMFQAQSEDEFRMHAVCHEAIGNNVEAQLPPMPECESSMDEECDPCEEKISPKESRSIFDRLFNRLSKGDNAHLSDDKMGNATAPTKTEEEREEERSLLETEKVLRELSMTVQKLRLEGISLMAIHEFIDKQEPLSRMTITPDYRIFLPDYNNMEIEMGTLPKAIYFLFLRYPEGIIYKHMPDYFNELLNIYKQLRPNTDEARLNLTITKVVNPLGNALNENIARIRKAFVEKFDEHLANNYIITGERGAQYSIPLDRELITWEE